MEYLAAEGLSRRITDLSKYIKKPGFFRNKRGSGAWDEVIYTLVGIDNANQLLIELAKIDPFLAVDCFEHVPQKIEVTDETKHFVTRQLINLFGSINPQAREAAVLKVVELGSITLSYLSDSLEKGNKVTKRASLKALAQFDDDPLAFKTIVLALENNNKWVRRDAQAILDNFELSKIEKIFEFLAQDEDAIPVLYNYKSSKKDLINSLSNDKNVNATVKSLIIDALSNTEANARQKAREYLAKWENNQIIDIVVKALDDQDRLIRKRAATTLRELGNTSMDNLDDPCPEVRGSAITALGKLGDANIVDKLIPYLQDEASDVRGSAITALGKLGDAQIIDKLIPYLQDEDPINRASTITALAKLGDAQIIDKLIPYLQDEASDVRGSARAALRNLGYDPNTLTKI